MTTSVKEKCFVCYLALFALVVAPTAFFSGCRLSREPAATVDPRAAEIWRKHEAVFLQALKGYQKDDEFEQACHFFEQLTGINMHLNLFTLGALPTAESEEDLTRLRAWYRMNKHRLYWDEPTQTVKVHPGSGHHVR